jgi:hypothetical protein
MVRTLKIASVLLCVAVAALAGFDCSVAYAQTGPGGNVGSLNQAQIVESFRKFDRNLQVQTLQNGTVGFEITMVRKSDGTKVTVGICVSTAGQVYMVTPLIVAKPGITEQQLAEKLNAIARELGVDPSLLAARTAANGQVVLCVEVLLQQVGSGEELEARFYQVLGASIKVLDALKRDGR